jgi:hypothetical protein
MSACIWIDVENRRKETLWNYAVSVVRHDQNIKIDFSGCGRSGSADRYDANHRVIAGLTLPIPDAMHLAQALLIAASKTDHSGNLVLIAGPNSIEPIHGFPEEPPIAEVLPMNKVSQIKFAGSQDSESEASD